MAKPFYSASKKAKFGLLKGNPKRKREGERERERATEVRGKN